MSTAELAAKSVEELHVDERRLVNEIAGYEKSLEQETRQFFKDRIQGRLDEAREDLGMVREALRRKAAS